jgi:hypothetical protein
MRTKLSGFGQIDNNGNTIEEEEEMVLNVAST